MKKTSFHFILCIICGVLIITLETCTQKENSFSFVFMTDIHLQPENNAVEGLKQAINKVNELKPDFVITGGDLIMDALGQSYGRADSLYNLYQELEMDFQMPVYNTMGNHEIYGIYEKSGADKNHPEYGEKMFEKRIGPGYRAFEQKGWKFFILNSVEDTRESKYIGLIDEKQKSWIKEELQKTDSVTPLVISTHIPLLTIFMQAYYGSTLPVDSSLVVYNSKEILDLFKGYNLKLVLQGHLHTIEDIYTEGVHFLTGGAVSSRWWRGKNRGVEEGFMLIKVDGQEFSWEYIDYGWEVK